MAAELAAKIRPIGSAVLRRNRTSGGGSDLETTERPFISNGMLAVLMVIASEVMLFSGFIGSFLIFRLSAPFWPPPALPRLPIEITWINTGVLLTSAVTMFMAVRAVHQNRQRLLRQWLVITGILGVTFLAVQGSEWVRLVAHGLRLTSGTYGATFYTLIGLHGAHVTAGVVWLCGVVAAAIGGRYNARNAAGVELCAVYWYFVCAIWPLLFVLVYLM
ncbi:MAG TPA: cytochrome c oxidase subunit 3 [Candidatus Binataceae bacterium]|nr:cytochrome c oxidase subunit 3 [Candidatus Binataceae bacterium]